jgi:radial spoke head protein 3
MQYRQDEPTHPANLMYDRRVVRGNTYAAQILPAIPVAPTPTTQAKPRRSRAATHKPSTPPPIQGRQHMDIQTDHYLEEVTDVQPEEDTGTQTDAFLERPVTPLFVPQKRGVDAETQIEEGELFDFDFEVEPLLEVLVGKTLEQGLMEVHNTPPLPTCPAHCCFMALAAAPPPD